MQGLFIKGLFVCVCVCVFARARVCVDIAVNQQPKVDLAVSFHDNMTMITILVCFPFYGTSGG